MGLALCGATALPAIALLTVGMPAPLAVVGVAILGVHALILVRRHVLAAGPDGMAAIEIGTPPRVRLIRPDGTHDDWEIDDAPLVEPSVVLLRLRRGDGGRRSLWLLRDGCPPDGHRRLRVLLRWRSLSAPPGEGRV